MLDFSKNNLNTSSSPYLQQHRDNPVHWQEWNEAVLQYAKEHQKLILVSIGYATCHWCHVMAHEAFSDVNTARYLNNRFVSIKVDREQRPDIDEYFMSYVNAINGRGGWPLNVVLTPAGHPIFGGTYFPDVEKRGLFPFRDVLGQVLSWYAKNKDAVQAYAIPMSHGSSVEIDDNTIASTIHRSFDVAFGGFGAQTKFPPHNTLLFLLHYYQATQSTLAKEMIIQTLDAMTNGGLHDHLQGGFYRYCVDREWTIPHFEKMLYDQAMHLWVYALAFQLFRRDQDRVVAEKIITALTETFSDEHGLFYSAHDADTDLVEGQTYVWSEAELIDVLSKDEYAQFVKTYAISSEGNFEGKNHLIKQASAPALRKAIEEKLLAIRKKRSKPFTDKKIVTSWNVLTGIGFIHAGRYLERNEYITTAQAVFKEIIRRHMSDGALTHSSLNGVVQKQGFLEDYASLLLLATYLYEDASTESEKKKHKKHMEKLLEDVGQFTVQAGATRIWFSNMPTGDFTRVPAQVFDHPTPSAVSLAEMALFRANILLRKENSEVPYRGILEHDFHNLVAFFAHGKSHEIHAPEKISWKELPINTVHITDAVYQDCTAFACHQYKNESELVSSFSKQ